MSLQPRKKSSLFLDSPNLLPTFSSLLNLSLSLPVSSCTMLYGLRLTRPRTCTCTHTYLPYRLMFSSVAFSRSIGAGFGNRNSDRGDPFVPKRRGGPSLARREVVMWSVQRKYDVGLHQIPYLKALLNKSMEGHHDAFARVEPGCWVIL